MKTIIFDTETTGLPVKGQPLEFQPYIIEFGAIYLDDDGSVIRTVNQLLNPGDRIWDKNISRFGKKLPPIITKITGITDAELVGKPSFIEFVSFLNFFFMGADLLIAHNAVFDVAMLKNELIRIGDNMCKADAIDRLNGLDDIQVAPENRMENAFSWPKQTICSMLEYTHQFGKWPKLTVMYERIMGKKLEQTHRAMGDVDALHEILVKDNFFEKIGESDA